MAPQTHRPEDVLNTHLDLLRGELESLPADVPATDSDIEELLAVAGLLARTLGSPEPNPAARAAARQRFLAAMRHPHLTLVQPRRTVMQDDGRPLPDNILPMTPRPRS